MRVKTCKIQHCQEGGGGGGQGGQKKRPCSFRQVWMTKCICHTAKLLLNIQEKGWLPALRGLQRLEIGGGMWGLKFAMFLGRT